MLPNVLRRLEMLFRDSRTCFAAWKCCFGTPESASPRGNGVSGPPKVLRRLEMLFRDSRKCFAAWKWRFGTPESASPCGNAPFSLSESEFLSVEFQDLLGVLLRLNLFGFKDVCDDSIFVDDEGGAKCAHVFASAH